MIRTHAATPLMVTVDVEEDMPRWLPEARPRLGNLAALPAFHAVAQRYGLRPTYLLTYPVIQDRSAGDMLLRWHQEGSCELAVHLHPWNTPPFRGPDERLLPSYWSALPQELAWRKLDRITAAFVARFGHAPKAFRAGRFGIGPQGLLSLASRGYLVDSSVTPGVSWAGQGGPNYEDAPRTPYRPDLTDIARPGTGPLLEVPLSIAPRRPGREALGRLVREVPGLRARNGLRRLLGLRPTWLRPTFNDGWALAGLVDRLLAEGQPVLNMMFHSSELAPGTSPYVRDAAQAAEMLRRIEAVLHHALALRDCATTTLSGYAALQSDAQRPAKSLSPNSSESAGRRYMAAAAACTS